MRGEDRKALILEQSKKVFARKGYLAASTGELARASGITDPMLYKHFGSKQKLYLAVLTKLSEEFLQRLRAMVERRAALDLLDSLTNLMLDYRNAAMADHDNIHLLLNAALELNDPEVARSARPITMPWLSLFPVSWNRPKNKVCYPVSSTYPPPPGATSASCLPCNTVPGPTCSVNITSKLSGDINRALAPALPAPHNLFFLPEVY